MERKYGSESTLGTFAIQCQEARAKPGEQRSHCGDLSRVSPCSSAIPVLTRSRLEMISVSRLHLEQSYHVSATVSNVTCYERHEHALSKRRDL